MINDARLAISAQALGIAQSAYDKAYKYSLERKQFNKHIIEFPAIYDKLVNMKLDIETSRTLLYNTACMLDLLDLSEKNEEDNSNNLGELKNKVHFFISLSKYYIPEVANKICYDALQIHGGAGYTTEFEIEKLYRDVRITTIYEGTSEIQIISIISGIVKGILSKEFEVLKQRLKEKGLENDKRFIKINEYSEAFFYLVKEISEKKTVLEYNSRIIADIASLLYFGYTILEQSLISEHKNRLANKFFEERLVLIDSYTKKIKDNSFVTIEHFKEILDN